MQKLLGFVRRAVTEYNMLQDGDTIGVGVSGGKDSVALLVSLARLRRFIGIDYKLVAITLDPGFEPLADRYEPIAQLCRQYEIPYVLKSTQIGPIVFEARQETNPCSLCARMRRGALHDTAKEHSCNKLALGHHLDDAVETFVMNLFNEGRVGCFSPVTYLSRKDITVIRPLVFAEEKDIRRAVRQAELPVVKSGCPIDGHTEREWTKAFLADLDHQLKQQGVKQRLFGAMKRGHISGW